MTLFVLDTPVLIWHVLIWLMEGAPQIGPTVLAAMRKGLDAGGVAVSAISFCEVAFLVSRGRVDLGSTPEHWHQEVLALGIRELPVTGPIAISAVRLPDFHRDPADRLIVAGAMACAATLVTGDQLILGWPGPVRRLDCRL